MVCRPLAAADRGSRYCGWPAPASRAAAKSLRAAVGAQDRAGAAPSQPRLAAPAGVAAAAACAAAPPTHLLETQRLVTLICRKMLRTATFTSRHSPNVWW